MTRGFWSGKIHARSNEIFLVILRKFWSVISSNTCLSSHVLTKLFLFEQNAIARACSSKSTLSFATSIRIAHMTIIWKALFGANVVASELCSMRVVFWPKIHYFQSNSLFYAIFRKHLFSSKRLGFSFPYQWYSPFLLNFLLSNDIQHHIILPSPKTYMAWSQTKKSISIH